MTEFEIKLKELFPDIYALHLLSKSEDNGGGGETHIWDIVRQLIEMRTTSATGSIYINYSKGKISTITIQKEVLAFSKLKNLNGSPNPSVDNEKEVKI